MSREDSLARVSSILKHQPFRLLALYVRTKDLHVNVNHLIDFLYKVRFCG